MAKKNPAVGVAKRRVKRIVAGEHVLSTGVKARLLPVSISIINEAQAAIPDPEVPMWYNEAKDTHEPNPDHPDYHKALEQVETDRNLAAIDAIIMFGVELVGGLPEDTRWLDMLKFREKRGLSNISLDEFDLDSELEVEFLYKKYIAVAATDTVTLMQASGVSEEDIAEAARSFRDNSE